MIAVTAGATARARTVILRRERVKRASLEG
jgi:hypothetical protein